MMDKPHELSQVGFAAKIEHPTERRMMMTFFPDLHEKDTPRKMIHHLLIALVRPPLCGEIVFAPGRHEPERDRLAENLVHL